MKDAMEDRPDVSLHPPTLFFAALLIGFIIRAFVGGWLPLPRLAGEGIGAVMFATALWFAISAVSAFAEGGETLKPATPSYQLLTGGPFKWSRNPIYLAMVLFGAGLGFATLNLWMILTAIATGVLLNFFVIPQEEDYLARRFGADYDAYRREVRRWV